jgi:MFS family permease
MNPLYIKISRRLVPFLMLLYLVAFLDRVDISFAKLTMNHDLKIGDDLFGLAAGIFFLGYFLFEVPSNLALLKLGARRWIMILMTSLTGGLPNKQIASVKRLRRRSCGWSFGLPNLKTHSGSMEFNLGKLRIARLTLMN